ncbi:hypothetical protein [Rhizobium sp.]
MIAGNLQALRRLISLGTIASLALSAYALAPKVIEIAQVFGIRDDPAKVLLYRLSDMDKPAYEREIAAALTKDDAELARSLADLAREQAIIIDGTTLAAIAEAEQFSLTRSTRQLFTGAVTGEADSPTAFAGALAADLTVVGDVRDLTQQAFAYPEQDNLTVALAATGVLLTGATAVTAGTSTAGKVGVSAIKAARKLKRLSKGLERQLVRLASDAVDARVLKTMTRDLGNWNFRAALDGTRRLIKPHVVDEIADTGGALSHVFGKQGYRGTLQVLEVADDTTDVRKLRRVSDTLGTKFRGALHLKRGGKLTLRVAEIALAFAWWISAIVGWLLWAAWVTARMSWKTGRLVIASMGWLLRRKSQRPDRHGEGATREAEAYVPAP